ncbi:MAG TPA: beta-galactosidase [Verrucomicrobia subdivision 3 bacterium]|nr:beta-galactosidase [Limisphaerales bacterium]
MTPTLSFAALAFALVLPAINSTAEITRVRESLDADWRFTKGDPAEGVTNLNYAAARAWLLPVQNAFTTNAPAARPAENYGGDVAFAQPGFDDNGWRKLNLPHDFGIEGPFEQALPGETGKLPWFGVAWYRKHFDVSAGDAGKQLYFDVDGAMAYSMVWINGHCVGGWPYGYASWRVNLTPFVKFGGPNTLAIRLDNPKDSSRWYPGGGIYRNVWLTKTAPVHVGQWGTYITTPQVSKEAATISLRTSVDNNSATEAEVKVATEIFELKADGAKAKKILYIPAPGAAPEVGGIKIAAGATADAWQTLMILKPKLWGVEHPNRYVAVTTITQGGKVSDVYETPFGIRTIQFTVDNGFLLNGERVRLNGVCDHADLGALGSAINTRGLERQLEILRGMGGNAIRTSHNPPAPELLDLCDKLGFVVMDETFDCWRQRKKPNDYHLIFDDWHEADARMLVRRDRNHPCVILWSIGNEISEQGNTNRFYIAHDLADIVHAEDPTRGVTAACNNLNAGYNGFQKIVDVFGYNYKPFEYGKFRAANPAIPIFGSETASTISSRGEYFFPVSDDKSKGLSDFQMSSYDLYAPRWATTPDAEFKGQDENPFVAGEFVWTGFDYIGEPTPYNSDLSNLNNYSNPADKARAEKELAEIGKIRTPSRSSYFGIIDLAGFPKDRYYLYQAHWRPDFPMAHILPHWNWPGREGEITPVHVYTSGDEAELFLNGKSLGRKKKGQFEYRLRWDDVKYAPGELKVVAYKNGKQWVTDVMRTTGAAAELTLKADRAKIAADGKDLSFVTVTVADAKGQLVPRSKNHIQFEVEGPGEIVAVDNGDATSFESFQAKERNAYNGLALVIVRANQPGKITLKAHADGLKDATTRITAQ